MKQHHIALIASERDRTVAFYGVLGFHVTVEHIRPEKKDAMILMTDGDTVLEIFVKPDAPKRPSFPEARGLRHIAFRTENLDETVTQLVRNGYAPEPIRRDTFTGERMTFVPDPDGLPVELHE